MPTNLTATISEMESRTNVDTANALVEILRSALPSQTGNVALHEPEFAGNEWQYVKECIDTGWVSSAGKYVERFEQHIAEFTGARYAVAVSNGTSALHIALLALGVRPGDEVIVPSLSFVATANAVAHCGATPHFVDTSLTDLGIDVEKLRVHLAECTTSNADGLVNNETGRNIRAIVPMHTFGHIGNIEALVSLADELGLVVVEDAAEALGSRKGGISSGRFGRAGVFSFNGNKIVTTGGGGVVVTDDQQLAQYIKHITTTAKLPHRWEFFHDDVGYNYRLPNLNAALGCAQLERLESMLARKRQLADRYRNLFRGMPDISFVDEPTDCESNFWLNAIRLNQPDNELRNAFLDAANSNNLQCRPIWKLLHTLPMYENAPRSDLSSAELLESSIINIPSSAKLGESFG